MAAILTMMLRQVSSVVTSLALSAQSIAACTADATLVFDGSGSMAEIGFDSAAATRIEEARAAIRDAMPRITPHRDVGLVIYGPGGATSCTGIEVRFPPAPDTAAEIIAEVEALRPEGLTPLSASVARAAEVLDYRREPAVIVLVTDGNETCGGAPCTLGKSLSLQAEDLTIHVIGFRVVVDFFSWNSPEQDPLSTTVSRCLADATGGLFVSAETVGELVDALNATLGCALIGGFEWPAAIRPNGGFAPGPPRASRG